MHLYPPSLNRLLPRSDSFSAYLEMLEKYWKKESKEQFTVASQRNLPTKLCDQLLFQQYFQ